MEWLWHPQILGLYKRVLNQCETNSTAREAAAGALQNITAGDRRVSSPTIAFASKHIQMRPKGVGESTPSVPQWPSVLSRVALEQERMLPTLLDLLRNKNDLELRSVTGFLRNLSRHAKDKGAMGMSLFMLQSKSGVNNFRPLTHLLNLQPSQLCTSDTFMIVHDTLRASVDFRWESAGSCTAIYVPVAS